MRTALTQLLGGPTRHARLVFVVTAAVAQSGDHGCLVDDLNRVYGLGWRQFNVLEINGLPPRLVRSRLADSDVIYAEGGNAYHLARSIADADLGPDLLSLLAKRVYVGASAGSMIFARHLTERLTGLFGTDDELYRNHDRRPVSPFNFFGWF